MRKPRHCNQDEPDCLNCPYPDCIATMRDINRQNRIQAEKKMREFRRKRNEEILELYNQGYSVETLGKRYNITKARIYRIISSLQ